MVPKMRRIQALAQRALCGVSHVPIMKNALLGKHLCACVVCVVCVCGRGGSSMDGKAIGGASR